jgi:hypothetical protein
LLPKASQVDQRIERYRLQSAARELLPGSSTSFCLRSIAFNPVDRKRFATVDLWHSQKLMRAFYKHLFCCHSVWACPVCAAKISERRRVELSEAMESFSGKVVLASFTAHHTRSDKLPDLLSDSRAAWRWMTGHRSYVEVKRDFGILGSVRALEVTYSVLNGWHVHDHDLYFTDGKHRLDGLESALSPVWIAALEHFKRSASWDRGVDVRTADSAAPDYVLKMGHSPAPTSWSLAHELAKSVVKRGRLVEHLTPGQLLSRFAFGDKRAGKIWTTYALAFKGRHQLTWSRGLRKLLGLGVEESDKVLVERAEENLSWLASLTSRQWQIVLANDARLELLQAGDGGDRAAVERFLKGLGAE